MTTINLHRALRVPLPHIQNFPLFTNVIANRFFFFFYIYIETDGTIVKHISPSRYKNKRTNRTAYENATH